MLTISVVLHAVSALDPVVEQVVDWIVVTDEGMVVTL